MQRWAWARVGTGALARPSRAELGSGPVLHSFALFAYVGGAAISIL